MAKPKTKKSSKGKAKQKGKTKKKSAPIKASGKAAKKAKSGGAGKKKQPQSRTRERRALVFTPRRVSSGNARKPNFEVLWQRPMSGVPPVFVLYVDSTAPEMDSSVARAWYQ